MKKRAFTLSEVLLVLSVIGLVAALTIPTLTQTIGDNQHKVAWKKAFSAASQAYTMAIANNMGSGYGTYSCTGGTGNGPQKWNVFKSNLNIIKECNGNTFGNCWAASGVGPDTSVWGGCPAFNIASQNASKALVTADGMSWFVYDKGNCEVVAVDVNGMKSPNKWGEDTFTFRLGDNSIESLGFCVNDNSHSSSYLYQ